MTFPTLSHFLAACKAPCFGSISSAGYRNPLTVSPKSSFRLSDLSSAAYLWPVNEVCFTALLQCCSGEVVDLPTPPGLREAVRALGLHKALGFVRMLQLSPEDNLIHPDQQE